MGLVVWVLDFIFSSLKNTVITSCEFFILQVPTLRSQDLGGALSKRSSI